MDGAVVVEHFNSLDHRCIYCKSTLTYPFKEIENIGSLCGACLNKSTYGLQNATVELEYVLVKLLMPCKYSFRGCNEKGMSMPITQHEKICVHRDKICPLYETKGCSVSDHNPDLMRHFSEYHSSLIYVSDSNSIEIKYALDDHETLNQFWMLIFEDENILLKIHSRDNKLYFLTYYMGNIEDFRPLTCKIQHHNNDVYTKDKTCQVLHHDELWNNGDDGGSGVWFSKTNLGNYFGQKLNTTITLETDILNVSNKEILLRLECPVCNNCMTSNIKLCVAGHSVCNECESKLDKCPLCTLPFCGARNFALEGIGDLLKILVRNEKMECPLKKELHCQWKGNDANIIEHVKDLHSDRIIISKNLKHVLEYTPEFLEINYLVTYGQVFKLVCKKDKYDDVMAVIVELIGHDEDAQKYYYNICFNSPYKQSIIWYTKSKVFARRRVEFYVDYLAISRLVCNSQFNISYTITKNNN